MAIATGRHVAAYSGQLRLPGAALHLKTGLLEAQVLSVKANLRPDAGRSAGVILAFDPDHFTLRAILDSADITAMRTAAIAAVAARRLAGPGVHSLAVIGAGPVARQSVAALSTVLSVSDLRLWSRDREHADEFAATLPGAVVACESVAVATAGADLVLTATPAREPLLQPRDVRPGALVLAMGADTAGKRELGEGMLEGAAVVADVLADALIVGECAYLPAGADRTACIELGELLAGQRDLPRGASRLVFDSVGSAVVDAAVTAHVLEIADREGAGNRGPARQLTDHYRLCRKASTRMRSVIWPSRTP